MGGNGLTQEVMSVSPGTFATALQKRCINRRTFSHRARLSQYAMASASAILLCTAFISLLAAGSAVRCYQCSQRNPKCQDPFIRDETTPLVQCISPLHVCAKNVATVNGQVNINRDCIMKDLPLPTGSGRLYTCDTDGCNSAPQHFSLLPAIIPLTAAVYMGTKL